MAFSQTPSQSTYQVRDVKLIQNPTNRNKALDKDSLSLNGFYDLYLSENTGTEDYRFVKRDGLKEYPRAAATANIRGMFFWEDKNKLYIAYDDKIDVVTGSTGALIATLTPFLTTTGDVGFSEFYYDDGSTKIVAGDGSRLITIDDSQVVVTGSDPDMPTPFEPNFLFLDGYLFIVKAGTSDIYNSNLNDPLAYTSGDFITAEMFPDTLRRIIRLNNYFVAMGTGSIEYFFNAAAPSGSPLQRNDTPVKQIGLLGGICRHANRVFFVGQSAETDPTVFMLEDLRMDEFPAPPIRRYLQPNTQFFGAVISCGGHDFYCLTAKNATDLQTFWMDLETKIWTRAAFQQNVGLPVKFSTSLVITGTGNSSLCVLDGDASLYHFDPALYQDDGVDFTVTLRTDPEMFETMREKYMSRVMLNADRPPANATIAVSVSDDDFQTFSTARSVELNQEFPVLHRWGRFRKRSFRMEFTANQPFRIKNLEVEFNMGQR